MADRAAVISAIGIIANNKVGNFDTNLKKENQTKENAGALLALTHFNISGQQFIVSNELVKKYPTSRLSVPETLNDHWMPGMNAYYFDRDPELFNAVLNLFRYNIFSAPVGYDSKLLEEELKYWAVEFDQKLMITDSDKEEEKLEAEFVWIENRIPPPQSSSTFLRYRYRVWCFVTDPSGPYTKFRKLSVAYTLLGISLMLIYLVFQGISTNAYYRMPLGGWKDNVTMDGTSNETLDLKSQVEAIGCKSLQRADCLLITEPLHWVAKGKDYIASYFFLETFLRLLLCPGLAYFKSVINWIDILATISQAIAFWLDIFVQYSVEQGSNASLNVLYSLILMESLQVLRVFKIFQVRYDTHIIIQLYHTIILYTIIGLYNNIMSWWFEVRGKVFVVSDQ